MRVSGARNTWRAFVSALVWGNVRANPLRSAVTIVAVALGVAIGLAVDLANATAVASFASSVNVISNHVNLQVLGVGRGFPDRTLLRVQEIPGVRYAGPAIEGELVVGERPGDPLSGEVLHVLGIDLMRPVPGDERERLGTPGQLAQTGGADPYVLIDGHGAIVSARVARRYRLERGGELAATAGDRPVTLRVSALLPPDVAGVDSSVVFVDIATAQEIFGKIGLLDRIDLVVEPARLHDVAAAVRAVLPPGTRAVEPRVRTAEIQRMLGSFQLNLAALAWLSLLVGMYLIYNMVAISVVQRRAEIGTLRALGATRKQIFGTFLLEGALFGVLGAAAGVGLGMLLAGLSVGAVARTVATLYVSTHADRVLYDPLLLAKAFCAGLFFAIAAAVAPAIEAAATPPAIAMRERGYESRSPAFAPRLAVAGIGALAIAALLARLPAVDGAPLFGYASELAIIFGASLLVPLAIAVLARTGVRLFARRSTTATLAFANMASALRRNSVAVAALILAIAMMNSVAVLISSFRTTVVTWAGETLQADLFIRPLGIDDASTAGDFSPEVIARIRAVPGVASLGTLRALTVPYHGQLTNLGAVDFREIEQHRNIRFLGAVDLAALAQAAANGPVVAISEPFSTRFGVDRGGRVTLETPAGPVTFTVAAIYNDYSSDAGFVLLDRREFARLFHDPSVDSVAVYARPGVDPVQLRSAILRALAPRRVEIQTTRELRAIVVRIFDRTFAITYALYVISITIAILGVVSTLFALVLERRREIGVLRYLGLSRAGVRRMVFAEAAWIGVLGGVGGIGVGMLLALVLIFVIDRQSFGWLIELHVPYEFFGQSLVLVVAAALGAGIYPAGVAARIATADAVRTE